ncbi:MAG: transglycosylase SLT domain-containing protein [Candidatus Taylorbacteria bacterium]|nr:transglycosylase SLT domain-containing protein [Candidatus Taylorbacteria bacterium]
MQLKQEEKINKSISKEFQYDFNISEDGLYILEISARAKSWLQNTLKFTSFFQDDDLAVEIDNRKFPKLSGKRGFFDSEAAWNGNRLAGLQQINLFCVRLTQGRHSLHFIADVSPVLETIKIYKSDDRSIGLEPSRLYQIESGNRRPWLIFVLIDIALDKLKIQASADKKGNDDDDLQIKINGERQLNENVEAPHKYWFWCGRVLKGQIKYFEKKANLLTGLHYIEFWADKTPQLIQIKLEIGKQKQTEGEADRIALYSDIDPEVNMANFREKPDENSEILEKIPNQTGIVIIKKAVRGTRPAGYLSDLWHEVFYRGAKGFVHSALIEIHGQERKAIVDAIKAKAEELGIDENLALNLAHCESKWLPFARSKTDNKGIYQLGESTIQFINEKLGGNVSDPYDPYQNIDGGLKYLKYLLERYKGAPDYLARVIAAWNAGPNAVSYTGLLNLKNYDPQVQDLVNCTLKERRGENVLKYLKFFILPLIIGVGLWVFFTSDDYKNLNARENYLSLINQQEIDHLTEGENFALDNAFGSDEKEVELGYLQTDVDGDQKKEKIIFTFFEPNPDEFGYYTNIYAPDGEKIVVDGSLWKVFVDDLTGDGIKELIVETIPGHLSTTYIFSYKNGRLEKIPIYDENGIEPQNTIPDTMLATSLEIRFKDLDGDGIKEIIMPIRNYGNEFVEPTYYYRWNDEGFILYDQRDIVYRMK